MASPLECYDKMASLRFRGASDADLFVVFVCDCACRRHQGCQWEEQEIRHVLVLEQLLDKLSDLPVAWKRTAFENCAPAVGAIVRLQLPGIGFEIAAIAHDRSWHFSAVPTAQSNVRYQG